MKSSEAAVPTLDASGVTGNERITAIAGALILVCAAVEIVTVPSLSSLLSLHFFIGVLMLGPVAVKTASTGWRFFRYYIGSAPYRRKGPPRLLLRMLSPVLLVSTVAVIASGIALAMTGPAPPSLLAIHKVSFLIWLVTILVHVLAYVWRVPATIIADWNTTTQRLQRVPGRTARVVVNVIALGAGLAAAVALLPRTSAWTGWLIQQAESGLGIKVLVLFSLVGVGVAGVSRVWSTTGSHR